MPAKQKLIGVCLSEAHMLMNTDFLDELTRAASGGYSVLVFNTGMDLRTYDPEDAAARSLFRCIPYARLSALMLICHTFHDEKLVREIISGALEQGVPVVCLGAEYEGCITVRNVYEDSFKALMQHVITGHGARDTFFLAGPKGEENSEDRLRCYREVLEENGLPFLRENVAYGNFWDQPAREAVTALIRSRKEAGKKLPDAIFCANDDMALAACETLKAHGIRVPEEVKVTGFDGIPAAFMAHPQLATCRDNPAVLAERVVAMIGRIGQGEKPEPVLRHAFEPLPAESCGCPRKEDGRFDTWSVFSLYDRTNKHENTLYYHVQQVLAHPDTEEFERLLPEVLLPDSAVFLNESFLNPSRETDYQASMIERHLRVIARADGESAKPSQPFLLDDLLPDRFLASGATLLCPVHSDGIAFGYYAVHTEDVRAAAQLAKRLSDVLNLTFAVRLGHLRQQRLLAFLENSLYTDPLTNLPNLKGLTRWFERYSAAEENRGRPLALSVYGIQRYSYIYETYGISDTEEIVRLTHRFLAEANPSAEIVARISEDQFAVVDSAPDEKKLSRAIDRGVSAFYRKIENNNAKNSRDYFIEISSGCTTLPAGWEGASLGNLIRLALGELYLNRLREGGGERDREKSYSNYYSSFSLLMEKNLFRYCFQPIVDAKTGLICAYEALMRTDTLINMMPSQILSVAREYNRLYDVEQMTFYGIMERYVRDYSSFQGLPVFINTIPGHFLSEKDCATLLSRFGSHMDSFVFELTEQGSTTDEELSRLKHFCKPGGQARIAIDDYGTGHSNIVNLLRYAPQIIKIDRGLISGIQNDSNKQLFVRNTIDFAHQNGIKALAEGVETADEMRTVISYGIDLLQGYYIGRPSEQPAESVSERVRSEIIAENLRLSQFDNARQVYTPEPGENLFLFDLAMNKYTYLNVSSGTYTLTGNKNSTIDMVIRIEDRSETTLILDQVNLKGNSEPCIQLGNGSKTTLVLRGTSVLHRNGIRVPASAALTVEGAGDLEIDNNLNYAVGIGSNYNDPYGTIVMRQEGTVQIHSSGDRVVCVGGGWGAGDGILLEKGNFLLSGNGIAAVGVGSSGGSAQVETKDARVSVHVEGDEVIGMGSVAGPASLRLSGTLRIGADGERVTGVGTISGTADVLVRSADMETVLHCNTGVCMGAFSGETTQRFSSSVVRVHGEGNQVIGLGSLSGACDTRIDSGAVYGSLLAGTRHLLGNQNSRCIITGGNIRLFPEDGHFPVSPGGETLQFQNPEGDHFEAHFRDRRSEWTYTASRDPSGYLGVYVPEQDLSGAGRPAAEKA